MNRQVTLRRYPVGMPRPDDFALIDAAVPEIGEGEVLGRALYLTVDPYIRVHISPSLSVGYARATPLGAPIPGEAVIEVVRSRHPGFREGDVAAGFGGWQSFCALPGDSLRKVNPALAPLPAHLGTLGMPGLTAYAGMRRLAEARAGETVFVSAALGGVGAVVGQLAKLAGCRAVGVSSTVEKCRYAVDDLGYDACLDRTAADFADQVAAACPDGIDVDFENAGGAVFQAVLARMKPHGRIVVCGLVSAYNDDQAPAGPDLTANLLRMIALKRLTMKGLMVADHWDLRPLFLEEVGGMIRDGRVKSKEHVVDGIENAGHALIDMLEGRNFGKTVVRVTDEAGHAAPLDHP